MFFCSDIRFLRGMPPSLSSDQRELSSAAARKAVNSVASRHTNSFWKRSILDVLEDGGEDEEDESSGEGDGLLPRKLLPQLREIPEEIQA